MVREGRGAVCSWTAQGTMTLMGLLGVFLVCSLADGNPQGYSIEIGVIVDKWAFENWTSIFNKTLRPATGRHLSPSILKKKTKRCLQRFIKAVFVGVNAIFETLKAHDIQLDVRIVDVHFAIDEYVTGGIDRNDTATMHRVLDDLRLWVVRHKARVLPADHIVLFTGLDLSDGADSRVVGVSNVGCMCTSNHSLSAVEALPNGNTILTFAHELAHSLNVHHDGMGDSEDCPRNSLMIMDGARTQASHLNFRFSPCSIRTIRQFLLDSGRGVMSAARIPRGPSVCPLPSPEGSCLTRTKAPPVREKPLGKLFDPDTICKMSLGPQSYLARSLYGTGGGAPYSQVCYSLMCYLKQGMSSAVVGVDGFTCAPGKVCKLGNCIESSHSSNSISADCPFGDPPSGTDVYKGLDCSGVMDGGYDKPCNTIEFSRLCCQTCQSSDCEDAPWCQFHRIASCSTEYMQKNCCKSCKSRTH
ncbi:metalloprotease mig-17-like [Babylonia areolata]|uniref:metalloprotease mig-17-like n=1 Tax=Babylonia areolata TaxID=304850 RepID=UPI003FD02676